MFHIRGVSMRNLGEFRQTWNLRSTKTHFKSRFSAGWKLFNSYKLAPHLQNVWLLGIHYQAHRTANNPRTFSWVSRGNRGKQRRLWQIYRINLPIHVGNTQEIPMILCNFSQKSYYSVSSIFVPLFIIVQFFRAVRFCNQLVRYPLCEALFSNNGNIINFEFSTQD